jgi:hypothetical protein
MMRQLSWRRRAAVRAARSGRARLPRHGDSAATHVAGVCDDGPEGQAVLLHHAIEAQQQQAAPREQQVEEAAIQRAWRALHGHLPGVCVCA